LTAKGIMNGDKKYKTEASTRPTALMLVKKTEKDRTPPISLIK
jgi:hypothetical protein